MNTNGTGLIIDNIYARYLYSSLIKNQAHYNFEVPAEYTSNKDDIIERELEETTIKE